MSKLIIVSIILFVAFSAKAQSFKTSSVMTISKPYLPFKSASVDFTAKKLQIGEDITLTITDIEPYSASKKRYFAEVTDGKNERFTFAIEIERGELVTVTQFVNRKEDWTMRK